MAELQREYDAFSRDHDATHEMLLPVTVDRLITEGRIKVRVLDAPGPWIGLTHASDLPGAKQALQAAAARGDYKTPLWAELTGIPVPSFQFPVSQFAGSRDSVRRIRRVRRTRGLADQRIGRAQTKERPVTSNSPCSKHLSEI